MLAAGGGLALLGAAVGARDLGAFRSVRVAAAALGAVAVMALVQGGRAPLNFEDSGGEHRGPKPVSLRIDSRFLASIAPEASTATGLGLAGAAAAFLAAAAVGRERAGRRILGGVVLAVALAETVYGAQLWFANSRRIWGIEVWPGAVRLRGTYINPNHFATLLAIALPITFAALAWALGRARREPAPERRLLLVAPPALLWLTLFAALAFSRSRSGLVAVTVATIVQAVLVARERRAARLGGVVLVGLGLAVVAAIGLDAGLGRWRETSLLLDVSLRGRVEAWVATLALWRAAPWSGVGLGAFRDAFPLVQPAGLDGTWSHAHDAPLELLATGGVLAVAIAAVGIAALVGRLLRVLRAGRRREDRMAAVAALGALLAVGCQELFEFGLAMPANVFVLAVVCGAAAATPAAAGPARPAAAPEPSPSRSA